MVRVERKRGRWVDRWREEEAGHARQAIRFVCDTAINNRHNYKGKAGRGEGARGWGWGGGVGGGVCSESEVQ